MIRIDNKEFRNLEEQVQKNKEDIAKHYQATQLPLNLAGIEVLGETDGDPGDDGKVGEKYGDAYVQIVDEDSAVLWIWTRANPDAGEPDDYWLDIPFTVVGKQGDKGDKGDKGDTGQRGSQWYFFNRAPNPSDAQGKFINDVWFNWQTAKIWHLHGPEDNPTWVQEGTIMGATGKTGPAPVVGPNGNWFVDGVDTGKPSRGDKGDPGPQGKTGPSGSLLIPKGIVTSIDQLPDPLNMEPNSAYYYSTTGEAPFEVWGIIDGQWVKVLDTLSTGSAVLVGGSVVEEFNADTKLDKYTTAGGGNKVYGVNNDGDQKMYTVRNDPQTGNSGTYKNQIVQYDIANNKNTGLIRIAEIPIENYHTASKRYVDNKFKVYQHNQHLILTYSDERVDIYYTCYDGSVNAKGYMNTNGMTGNISGYYTLSNGHQLPILYGEIDTDNYNMSIAVELDGQINTHYIDSFSVGTIEDIVTRVI